MVWFLRRGDNNGGAVPRKVRQIKAELIRAGFDQDTKQGKGSHSKWTHPLVRGAVILSGHDGDDVQPYQEKDAREALRRLRKAEENRRQ